MTTVVDATCLVSALVGTGKQGTWAEEIVASEGVVAPELILVETANALRELESRDVISQLEASAAHRDLLRLNLQLFPYEPLAPRVWQLRKNLTAYDATYVALAGSLGAVLATLDLRLSKGSAEWCRSITPRS